MAEKQANPKTEKKIKPNTVYRQVRDRYQLLFIILQTMLRHTRSASDHYSARHRATVRRFHHRTAAATNDSRSSCGDIGITRPPPPDYVQSRRAVVQVYPGHDNYNYYYYYYYRTTTIIIIIIIRSFDKTAYRHCATSV